MSLTRLALALEQHVRAHGSRRVSEAALRDLCSSCGVRGHVAYLQEPYLSRILQGTKTIESRLSAGRRLPFGWVSAGDVLILKESGGPIRGLAVVTGAVSREKVTPKELRAWLAPYLARLQWDDDWSEKKLATSDHAMLMELGEVRAVEPIVFERGRELSGWIVL